jgi:hypothetical protein
MLRAVELSGKRLQRKRIREFALANPLVNEKSVRDSLALFSEIEKVRKDRSSRPGFRIARPYSSTLDGLKNNQDTSIPVLRYGIDY